MDISGMYFDSCSGPARVGMLGVPAYLALLILQWASGKWTLSKMNATAVLLQVSDRPLDHIASAVDNFVQAVMSVSLAWIRALRDQIKDLPSRAPRPDSWIAVPLVAGDPDRLAAVGAHTVDRVLEVPGLVGLPGRDRHSDGDSGPTTNQMQLGLESASGASEGVIGGFLRPVIFGTRAAPRACR